MGLTENYFKTRYRNHTTSFWHTKHRNSTKLTKISVPLKKITLTTLFYGTSFHQDHPTTVQAKDATSASKKNYLSSTNLNYHHSINVMNTCPHTTTEINNYCVTVEQSIEISRHAFMQVCKLYKWWLWIFFTIKSPDEWVITKQACRDESIVSVFSPISYILRSTSTYQALYNRKIRSQTSYMYIYV